MFPNLEIVGLSTIWCDICIELLLTVKALLSLTLKGAGASCTGSLFRTGTLKQRVTVENPFQGCCGVPCNVSTVRGANAVCKINPEATAGQR